MLFAHKTALAMFNMGFFLNLTLMTGAIFYRQIVGGDSRLYVYPLTRLALLQFVGLLIFKCTQSLKIYSMYSSVCETTC